MIRDGLFYLGGIVLGTVLLHPLPSAHKPRSISAEMPSTTEAKAIH